MPLDTIPRCQPVALGFRPSLTNGHSDWSRYCLRVVTFTGAGPDDYRVEQLTFPDKPEALAHAATIGARFTV